jgi:hypothetical protein
MPSGLVLGYLVTDYIVTLYVVSVQVAVVEKLQGVLYSLLICIALVLK